MRNLFVFYSVLIGCLICALIYFQTQSDIPHSSLQEYQEWANQISQYQIRQRNTYKRTKYAYLTLLSSDDFLYGTMALIESIRLSGSTYDIVVMILPHLSDVTKSWFCGLEGVYLVEIEYIENPYPLKMVSKRQRFNFSKLQAWTFIEYEKVVLLGKFIIFTKRRGFIDTKKY